MTLKINGATGGSVSLDAPDNTSPAGTDVTLTLPTSAGSSGQYLQTNGSGTLSWQTVSVPTSFDNITEGNTTVECVDTGSDGHITFDTEGSERARFTSAGRFLIGGSTTHRATFDNGSNTCHVQLEGADGAASSLALIGNANATFFEQPRLILAKAQGSGLGNTGAMQNPSVIGDITFQGSDGTEFVEAARIRAQVDNTPGANDMPTSLKFYTTENSAATTSERLRIRNNGHLRINMNNFDADVSGSNTGVEITPGSFPVLRISNGDATTNAVVVFFNTNGVVGTIQTSGSSTFYNTSSDYRLKENVVDLDGAIDRVNQLQVYRFNFIADPDKTVDGFMAHEAQTVVPECATGFKDEVEVWKEGETLPDGVSVGDNKLDEDGNTIPVYQGIDQSKLVPLLTAALQEAIAKIETLETRLTALEGGAA